jgi:hypothetical protein
VGIVGTDTAGAVASALEIFPGKTIVPIPLDPVRPLPGDPMAWETLDAVVFDEWSADAPQEQLISAGVTLIVRNPERPADGWPWQGRSGHWVIFIPLTGPRGAVFPPAYEPAYAWRPGWPTPLRRQAVLLAVVFSIVALAASLWRRSWQATALVVALSAAAIGGFAWWGARQPLVREAGGGMVVNDGSIRYDRWDYVRPLRSGEVSAPWLGRKPMLASARHLREIDLRLNCDGSGQPTGFTWRGEAGTTVAFLIRSVDANPGPRVIAPQTPVTSPMLALVRGGYLSEGDVVEGEIGPDEPEVDAGWSEIWPSVVVRRGTP